MKTFHLRWAALVALCFPLINQNVSAVIRDGGIDPANLGKGDWVYYTSAITSGLGGNVPSVTNLASFFAYEKSQGVRYVIYKSADGSTLFRGADGAIQFTTSLVNAAHAAGLLIFGYNRSGKGGVNVAGEVSMADYVFNQGADGYVWDAESEWEASAVPNNLALAWQICGQVRTNWPNKFLAHAPFPIISYHSSFPYKEFGYWSDAVMPQIYHYGWTGVQRSPSGGINWSDANWISWQNGLTGIYTNAIKPLAPIGHVYGPNPPNGGVTEINASDVGQFIDYLSCDTHTPTAGGYKGVSFWRADLHGAAQWTYIKQATIGSFPGIVNNIVIDNDAATRVGSWTSVRIFNNGSYFGTTETNTFGTNYYSKTVGTGAAYVEFTPNVLVGGNYDVYEWHPRLTTASAGTPFIINFDGGSVTNNVNQQINSGNWNKIGRYSFAAGASGNIRVADNFSDSSQVAVADGVKLIYVPPVFPPTAPTGLIATAVSNSQINLRWTDTSSNEASFVIATSTNSGGPYSDIATVNADVTNYSHTGVSPVTLYYYVVRAVNVNGVSTNSNEASATTLGIAPVITVQPQNLAMLINQTANFSVTATGSAPLNYQWRFNAAAIPGATNSAFSRGPLVVGNQGSYSVVITNTGGSVTSSNAILLVTTTNVPPAITTQPQTQTVIAGNTANLSVVSSGTMPLSYQWFLNTAPIAGATGSIYSKPNVQLPDAGSYFVIVTNSVRGATSAVARLTVNYSLTIIATNGGTATNLPNQTSYAPGSTVTVTATASTNYNFGSWSGDVTSTNNPLDVTMTTNLVVIPNFIATPTEFIIDNPQATVTGSWSTGTSSADKFGDDYRFKSGANGDSFLTYTPSIYYAGLYQVFEWHPKGNNRPTGAPYVINHAAGSNTVRVNQQNNGGKWNSLGTFTFDSGTNGNVMITDAFTESGKVVMADAVRFVYQLPPAAPSGLTAVAINASQINLTWQDNSTNENNFIVGRSLTAGGPYVDIATVAANTTNYNNFNLTDATTYYYVVRAKANGLDSTLSNEKSATTLPGPPIINTQPLGREVSEGQMVSFAVVATSSTPIHYQWRLNQSIIPGATNSTLNLGPVLKANAGEYSVELANQVAEIVSDAAVLIVHYALNTSSDPSVGGAFDKSPNKSGYEAEDIVTLTAVTNYQYEFIGWTGDVTGTNNPVQLPMTSSKNLVAHFLSRADLIVDNPDATYFGNWVVGTDAPGKFGEYYQLAASTTSFASSSTTYTPQIVVPGKYDVFIWYPAASNRTANAQIFINCNSNGVGISVDETLGGGDWQLLEPALDFATGLDGFVQISNDTGEANRVVIADAVRFAKVNAPVIVNSPQDQTVNAGTSANFSVVAGGTAALSYQWQRNGSNIPGATNGSLQLFSAKGSDAGSYSVVVSNRIGTATSVSALLIVLPPAAPQLSLASRLADGRFRFNVAGDSNVIYSIDVSTNLVNWINVTNILNSTGTITYTDPATNLTRRFYRARWAP